MNPHGNLVYAHQDSSRLSNDLILINDGTQYVDTGLTFGLDPTITNLRISYNTHDSSGHINGAKLSIDTPLVSMPFLSKSTTADASYLVIDNNGYITTGGKQYKGDINLVLNTIQKNLSYIEAQMAQLNQDVLDLDPNKLLPNIRFSRLWTYILMGVVAVLFLICVFLFIQWLRTSSTLSQVNRRLEQIEQRMGIQNVIPCQVPQQPYQNQAQPLQVQLQVKQPVPVQVQQPQFQEPQFQPPQYQPAQFQQPQFQPAQFQPAQFQQPQFQPSQRDLMRQQIQQQIERD